MSQPTNVEQRTSATVPQKDDDFVSHYGSWREALIIARDHARVVPPDVDDRAYWDHEIRAYDDAFAGYSPRAIPDDFLTHHASWREALVIARDRAIVQPPDVDDRSYWDHELRAYDRAFASIGIELSDRNQDAMRSHDISEAKAAGFKVEFGGPEADDLRGRWWWTLIQPGWSGIEASEGDFNTEAAAWADAVRLLRSDASLSANLPESTVAPVVARFRADGNFNEASADMRRLIEQQPPELQVVLMQAYSSVLTAAEAVRDQYQSDWRAAKASLAAGGKLPEPQPTRWDRDGIQLTTQRMAVLRPDFDAIRDKRRSELTPAQQEDSLESWLRDQVGTMPEYHEKHYRFLSNRLDEARRVGLESPGNGERALALHRVLSVLEKVGADSNELGLVRSIDRKDVSMLRTDVELLAVFESAKASALERLKNIEVDARAELTALGGELHKESSAPSLDM
ncbi:hypothetical protein [Burkholderia ubonensis]|uniref:hypothetical protein n=1 Tax=Burkholderia ubonensis TaxID=101571 RepID=UPI0007544280|nr:hypothetical protein [Burkholderia ubonensis]KVV07447.1 hypothetical protein WK77_16815 [Burkholderia ubonensis]